MRMVLLLAVCLACTPTPGEDARANPQADLARLIRQPETVHIYSARPEPVRSTGQDAGGQQKKSTRAGMFGFSHEGPVLTEADRQALAASWVSPQDYKPGRRKLCSFNADIALRFQRADTWVDAVVCFTCGEVWFFDMKRESIQGGAFNDFTLLMRLATQAFPGEKFGLEVDY